MPSVWGVIDKKDDPFGTSSELKLMLTSTRPPSSSRVRSADLFPLFFSLLSLSSLAHLLVRLLQLLQRQDAASLCRKAGTDLTRSSPTRTPHPLPPSSPRLTVLAPAQPSLHTIPTLCFLPPLQLYPPPFSNPNPSPASRSLATLSTLLSFVLNASLSPSSVALAQERHYASPTTSTLSFLFFFSFAFH